MEISIYSYSNVKTKGCPDVKFLVWLFSLYLIMFAKKNELVKVFCTYNLFSLITEENVLKYYSSALI